MLAHLSQTLIVACHMIGTIMQVAGGLTIGLALLGGSGPIGFVRGGALLVFGTWFARLAG